MCCGSSWHWARRCPVPTAWARPRCSRASVARALELVRAQYAFWNDTLLPALGIEGIRFVTRDRWTVKQKRWLQGLFPERDPAGALAAGTGSGAPVPAHPQQAASTLPSRSRARTPSGAKGTWRWCVRLARCRASSGSPRKSPESPYDFVFLAGILQQFIDEMFPGMRVEGSYQFRVTRNSELVVDEDEVENLAAALSDERWPAAVIAHPVRLEVAESCPKAITDMLMANFQLTDQDIYRCAGPVNINRIIAIYDQVDRADLKFPKFTPRVAPAFVGTPAVLDAVREQDVLLHHPFESFGAVIELVRQASQDPDVLAIKQTLYRVGDHSPLVSHLVDAARNGKDVTVVVELRARFDEEANIRLANRLQEAGVQVVYGVVGYKTHAKMLLIVRREEGKLRRYVHLSTGNYHQMTSKVYTDFGLMTADPDIGEDVHKMFQQLSGLGTVIKLKRLMQSPFTLHKGLLTKIEREIAHARAGNRHASSRK
ncbi:polyphosphate kinase [Paucibacter sp. O1-1]|nr:polyphosphate kinase [Paucibacter sp. O1-1]MDA3831016.1 polyphosphate kinase [Paucibacter sp. O1-1]